MADKGDKAAKPVTVKVEALKFHTNAGESYDVGDTYEVDEAAVDNLAHLGMAVRVDRVDVARKAAADAEKSRKARSTAVEPMSTTGKGKALAKPRARKAGRK